MPKKRESDEGEQKSVSLKSLAAHLQLSPATISLVINKSPRAQSIPKTTQDRIFEAARKLNYKPNFFARSLRSKKTFTVGVLVPEAREGYSTMVIRGIENYLLDAGYFYFMASHHRRPDLIDQYPNMLMERSVEGFIIIDTVLNEKIGVPVVTVSGHQKLDGVTNVVLDHRRAAELALRHLVELGHKNIAFMKGQSFSSDTEVRWDSICRAAGELKLNMPPELCVELLEDTVSPQLGIPVVDQLLKRGHPFTALFAFNDTSAIGAIHSLREAGLRVPEDVSVVGFDDIPLAAFQNPALTTVRQPLEQMGATAARALLDRIQGATEFPDEILVEPELAVRKSTGPVKGS
jgi:DNA-binding LacI/PurR family transcriptional regulator